MTIDNPKGRPLHGALGDHEVRHALFVAFHFPPEASSSGVLRTLKFARYLPDYGWRVTVLAPNTDAYAIVDPRLEEQVAPPIRVVRTRWLNTKKHLAVRGVYPALFALPDQWIGWLPWAVAAGRTILREDPPSLLYSTSPLATAHLIALMLARSSKLPWVTDFRDPWYEEPPEPGAPSGRMYMRFNKLLESRVIYRSTRVVASTSHLRDELRARYQALPPERFVAIPNGYDEADFATLPNVEPSSDRFVLVHTGSINGDFRDPRPLFRSISRLVERGVIQRQTVCLRFVGAGDYAESAEVRAALADANLQDRVEFVPRVPFDEALRELARANVLLLLQASADTVGLVPAKLYEYLRSRRPILALVLGGASAEVMASTGGGWAVDPADDDALDTALSVAYKAWITGDLPAHLANLDALLQFDRKSLTGQLAEVFEQAHGQTVRKA